MTAARAVVDVDAALLAPWVLLYGALGCLDQVDLGRLAKVVPRTDLSEAEVAEGLSRFEKQMPNRAFVRGGQL